MILTSEDMELPEISVFDYNIEPFVQIGFMIEQNRNIKYRGCKIKSINFKRDISDLI